MHSDIKEKGSLSGFKKEKKYGNLVIVLVKHLFKI